MQRCQVTNNEQPEQQTNRRRTTEATLPTTTLEHTAQDANLAKVGTNLPEPPSRPVPRKTQHPIGLHAHHS